MNEGPSPSVTSTLVERLDDIDDIDWCTRYSMLVTGPLPHCRTIGATISLFPASHQTVVHWCGFGSFVPDGRQ